MKTIFMNYL